MNAVSLWLTGFLVNAAWQVPLLFAAAWFLTRSMHDRSLALRHRIWVGVLAAQAIVPAFRIAMLNRAASAAGSDLARLFGFGAPTRFIQSPGVHIVVGAGHAPRWVLAMPRTWLPWLAIGYFLLVVIAGLRTFTALLRTMRVRRAAEPATLAPETAAAYARACTALGRTDGQQAILLSTEIAGPLTIGIRRPAILVPSGLLDQLGADDLDALFTHELAHIARGDFARNLLYRLLLTPLAFHPFAFRTLAHITETREMLCDDLAAGHGLGERRYARSLLRLATLLAQRPAGHLYAIGLLDANSFERRIMRLTSKTTALPRRRALQFAVVAMLSTAACASAMAFHLDIGVPRAPRQQGASTRPARIAGGVMAGEKLSGLNPIYPPQAKADKVGGSVKLQAIIGADGSIQSLAVIESVRPDIDRSAIDAVKTWRYTPYLLNGQPTEVDTVITVTYNIGDDAQ